MSLIIRRGILKNMARDFARPMETRSLPKRGQCYVPWVGKRGSGEKPYFEDTTNSY